MTRLERVVRSTITVLLLLTCGICLVQAPVATESMGQALRDVQRLESELSETGERLGKRLTEETVLNPTGRSWIVTP